MNGTDEINELKKLQNKQKETAQKELPNWTYTDDKGTLKVDTQKLGYEIIKETSMIRTSTLTFGARFDKLTGAWRIDALSDYLEGIITNKLESVGKWSRGKMSEVKTFIWIKINNPNMKDSPFNHSKPYLANFKNGTYNIQTGEMKPHDIKDYILQSHDYAIDPNTVELPVNAIKWLEDLTADPDSAKFLMEFIGYCFYRTYKPFPTIAILQGSGENGKSTFLDILGEILSKENVSNHSLETLGNNQNRFATSGLFQKEANIFADIGAEFLKSTNLLKALTGGDSISAEFKGKDGFSFINCAKLIFSANELPAFADFTDGFYRRMHVVPFPVKINAKFKQQHDLQKIRKEIPLLAVYCMRLFNEVLKRGEFTVSDKMKAATDHWFKEADHVARFIDEMCVIDKESNIGESSKMVYEEYRNFCYLENLREVSQPTFTKRLEKMGIYKKNPRTEGQRVKRYIHLTLKKKMQ